MSKLVCFMLIGLAAAGMPELTYAEVIPARGVIDSRVRDVSYADQQVYKLRGFVGYQIDLQFEHGERFVGLGAGDIEGIEFAAQDNHLFLKPRAAIVGTNLTVLTDRRFYQFDYTASDRRPAEEPGQVTYALRFEYPVTLQQGREDEQRIALEHQLESAESSRPRNLDYWYCGEPQLQPIAASDDGVQTRLRFGVRRELPAIFVRNDDDSESLLNFNVEKGEVVIHRVARRFIVRRGAQLGCIVNKAFSGSGEQLRSGTIASGVERLAPGETP